MPQVVGRSARANRMARCHHVDSSQHADLSNGRCLTKPLTYIRKC
jgi:hypothetical protein